MQPPATARRRPPAALVAPVAIALVPVAFFVDAAIPPGPLHSGSVTGRLWMLVMVAPVAALAVQPLDRATWRDFLPYGAFLFWATATVAWAPDTSDAVGTLLRLAAPAFVYLAVRAAPGGEATRHRTAALAAAWVGVAWVLFLVDAADVAAGYDFPNRLGAMAGAAMFAVVASAPWPRWRVAVVGCAALGLALATGSRAATVVVAVMLIASPMFGRGWRPRLVAGAIAVLIVGLALPFPSVRDRWFARSDGGTLLDVATARDNVATSGRADVWEAIWDDCHGSLLLGRGLGWSNGAGEAAQDGFSQPHNEYLRLACDTGVPGLALLGGFYGAVGYRAVRRRRAGGPAAAPAGAALMALAALALFAAVENPLTATLQFAAPLAVLAAWSDDAARRDAPPPLRRRARASLGGRAR